MKKISILVILSILFSTSCKVDVTTTPDENPEVTNQDFTFSTTENSIIVKIAQDDTDDINWYKMSIEEGMDSFNVKGLAQDLNNDTLTYNFRSLMSKTTYKVKVEGKDYANGGKILSSGTKEITTD